MADSNIAVKEELKEKLMLALSKRDERLTKIEKIAERVAIFTKNIPVAPTCKDKIEFKNEVNRLIEVYKQRKQIKLISRSGDISKKLEFNWTIGFYCFNRGELLKELALVEKDGLPNVV